ncbi:uncharacterized protein LOC114257808 [Camellia sinensis]|uniref:uncharacterized protein LOC114257808 n=1 Tax=Camellia sinensis TaxID=4442 RepID=UPI001036573D|nr:uncharacterized protein LOC114257808 [Camellia sinensis]
MRFGVRGKLSPRFVGPFEVLDRIGEVAYRLALPPSLAGVHNVFHVLMLRKYVPNPNHVIDHAPLQFKEDLTYEERPVRIVDKKEQVLRRRVIHYVKVQWSNHLEREATWELDDEMRQKHPQLFETPGDDDDVANVDQVEEVLTGPFPGGPSDPSVLKSFKAHIAATTWD